MIDETKDRLKQWFENQTNIMIALSGGVDSCLVAFLGRHFMGKQHCLAVIGDSPSLKRRDLQIATDFCIKHDIAYTIINPDELSDPNYAANPANRCYFCKSALYDAMLKLQKSKHPDYTLVNGNNYDDRGDYRPGLEAAKENASLSPLMECKLTKQNVRDLARHYHLEVWDKPASPCLSSRFPYGESINKEKLELIENAENYLFDLGFTDCRVRYFSGNAKIEVPAEQLEALNASEQIIKEQFRLLGFTSVEIDSEGLISGKLNRALGFKVIKQ